MPALLRAPSLSALPSWRERRPLARSRPKPPQDFGTVQYLGAAGATWDGATVSVSECRNEDEFVIIGWGASTLNYMFTLGYAEGARVHTLGIHASSAGSDNTQALGIIRRRPDAAWTSSLTLGTGSSTYRWAVGGRFRAGPGFRGELTRFSRHDGASSTSFAMTPPTNPGPPGGLLIAHAEIDVGGVGPNASVSGDGWVYVTVAGVGIMAYRLLPLDRVLTPPAATFSCARSDFWTGTMAYLR